ncbi:MAG: MFS transporter [Ktedonobacteraceae bacterium]
MSDIAPSANVGTGTSQRITTGYARYVFWVMFLISFLNYLDRNVLTGAANVIAKELGFNLDGIGYIATAFLIVYTLGTVPLGIWADRAKRRDVVAISVAFWSIATAATALATNFATLFLSRMILGIGEAGYFPAGTALMSDYFCREKRSRIMSWWSVAQLVGILVGFVLGGTLAGLYPGSWRLAFIFTGIPGLLLAFLIWRIREPRRNQADEEELTTREAYVAAKEAQGAGHPIPVPTNVFAQFGALLRIKTLVVLIVMQVFAFFVLTVNVVFLPTYLQQKDTFGLTSGQAGLFSGAVVVLAGMTGTVLGGYMADWLNKHHAGSRILVCGIGFLLGAPAFAIAVTFHNLLVFTIFFVISTLLLTIYTGPSTAATQDVAPSTLRASAVALSLLIAHLLGDAFSPTLVGVLATNLDPTHGQHFVTSMAGQDLSTALLLTCTPALVIAGLVGVFGAGWMKDDVAAAEEADIIAKG